VAFFIDKGVKMKKILGLALLISLLVISQVMAWSPPGGWNAWKQAMTTFGFSATDSSKTTMNKGLLFPANAYLNFGSTYGTSGYGLRDNAGTPQYKASGGAWTDIGSGGGGAVATDAIWDAAGDLVQATGNNAAVKLPAGTAGKVLRAAGAGVAVDWSGYIIALPNTTNQVLQSDGTNWNATSNPSISTINLYGTNSLNLGTASSLTGQAKFKSSGSADVVTLQAGTTSGSYTLTFPPSVAGGANYLLNSSTAGVLGYTNPSTFSVAAGSSSITTVGALGAGSLAAGFTPVTVPLGGTGASTYALNGVLYGNAANPIGVTAIGAEGQILRAGASPFVPAFSTATYPNTVATGDVLVGTNTNTVGVVAKGAAVAGVLGWDAAGTLAKYTSMSFDNTAAQFYDSVAPTKLVKIDPVGVTAGKTATLAFSNTDNATLTFPSVTASLAPLTSPVFVTPNIGAATGTSLSVTGTLSGKMPTVVDGAASPYSISVAEARAGTFFMNTLAGTKQFILPAAEAGMAVCIRNGQGVNQILQVHSDATDFIVMSTGVRTSASTDYYGATASVKNQICLVVFDTTDWYVTSEVGTWTEE
jgi:hypothetical protein